MVESGNGGCPGGTLVPFVDVRHFQFCTKRYRYHARIVQSFTCFTPFDMDATYVGALRHFFPPQVRTPCGHGAQSSLKGGKNSLMVEKRTRKPNTTQNKQPKAHRPGLLHHAVFPLCQVKRVKRKRVSRNGPEFTNEKHIGAGLCSSKVTKKASKGLYFTIASDQRPHHGAAKSWLRRRSGV